MIDSIIEYFAGDTQLLVGNFFGLIATVFSFIAFQMKTPKKLLFMNGCVIVTLVTSYAILGAWSGMALNLMCLGRNITFALADKKPFCYKWWPYVCALIVGSMGIFSWQGPVSLLVIIALMANTVFMSLNDNYKLRVSVLFTSPAVIVYNAFFRAYMPIIMESAAIISSAVAIVRYKSEKKS